MQRDFWTLHADGRRKRFVFVWDARFGGLARLEGLVRAVRPSAIVFGSGVWFVWSGLRDFRGYRKALVKALAELRTLADKPAIMEATSLRTRCKA